MSNLRIKIPDQIYLGFIKDSDSNLPFGIMTPYGTDKAARNRMATIDFHSSRSNNLDSVVLDNQPMVGFKISRSLRRLGWTGHNTVIRVEDPRGFEVDINAPNMVMLTDENTIQNGEILSECVWGRDGTNNILLPVNSLPYLEAKENTRRHALKASIRDVKIGDVILTKNGMTATYMGKFFSVLMNAPYNPIIPRKIHVSGEKRHLVKCVDTKSTRYVGSQTIKVSEIITPTPKILTLDDSWDEMKSDTGNTTCLDVSVKDYHWRTLGFTKNQMTVKAVDLVPVESSDIVRMVQEVVEPTGGKTVIVGRSSHGELLLVACENFYKSSIGAPSWYLYCYGAVHPGEMLVYDLNEEVLQLGIIEPAKPRVCPKVDVVEMFLAVATLADENGVEQKFTL